MPKLLLLFLFVACTPKATPPILLEDRKNKELELMYLEEIRMAEENQDKEAYRYFFKEYIDVPRLEIPDDLKSHPDYFKGGRGLRY